MRVRRVPLNRSGYPFVAAIVVAIGYAAVHVITLLAGSQPMISYLLLSLGVATWAWALHPSGTLAAR